MGVLELTDYFDIIVSGQEFVHSKAGSGDLYLYHEENGCGAERLLCGGRFYLWTAGSRERRGGRYLQSEMTGLVYDQSGADYYIDRLAEIEDICLGK